MQIKIKFEQFSKNLKSWLNAAKKNIYKLCGAAKIYIGNLKKSADLKFSKWKNTKTPPQTSAMREKAENGFFYILAGTSTAISIAILAFWGADVEGSKKPLEEARITQVEFNGFDKDTKNCLVFTNPYRTKFKGVAQDGRVVSGTVCKNYLGHKQVYFNK